MVLPIESLRHVLLSMSVRYWNKYANDLSLVFNNDEV